MFTQFSFFDPNSIIEPDAEPTAAQQGRWLVRAAPATADAAVNNVRWCERLAETLSAALAAKGKVLHKFDFVRPKNGEYLLTEEDTLTYLRKLRIAVRPQSTCARIPLELARELAPSVHQITQDDPALRPAFWPLASIESWVPLTWRGLGVAPAMFHLTTTRALFGNPKSVLLLSTPPADPAIDAGLQGMGFRRLSRPEYVVLLENMAFHLPAHTIVALDT